jgi:High potential iron-sulfur protein
MLRQTFLKSAIVLPGLAVALGAPAMADSSKATKATMHYQDSPSGDSHCSLCKFFIPGQDASSNGTCQIVDGSISPNGYCMAFAGK